MPRLILFLALLFGASYAGIQYLEYQESLSSLSIPSSSMNELAPPKRSDPIPSVILTRVQSPTIEARRLRARQGVSAYLDWHYSVSGSLSEQAELIASAYKAARASLSGDATEDQDLAELIKLSEVTRNQLHKHIFTHLTTWSEEEFQALVREVRGDRQFLAKLYNEKVTRDAIERLQGHQAPSTRPKVGVPSEMKLGASGGIALGLTVISMRMIERISRVLSYRLARRAMITTMYRGGVVLAGAEGAGTGAAGCAAGGFLGSLGCATVGVIAGVLISEWALNEVDETWSRPELERALNEQIDEIFDEFELDVTRAISSHARQLFQRAEKRESKIRIIDLFE